jgi:hypothetical protein
MFSVITDKAGLHWMVMAQASGGSPTKAAHQRGPRRQVLQGRFCPAFLSLFYRPSQEVAQGVSRRRKPVIMLNNKEIYVMPMHYFDLLLGSQSPYRFISLVLYPLR